MNILYQYFLSRTPPPSIYGEHAPGGTLGGAFLSRRVLLVFLIWFVLIITVVLDISNEKTVRCHINWIITLEIRVENMFFREAFTSKMRWNFGQDPKWKWPSPKLNSGLFKNKLNIGTKSINMSDLMVFWPCLVQLLIKSYVFWVLTRWKWVIIFQSLMPSGTFPKWKLGLFDLIMQKSLFVSVLIITYNLT